jgi:phosphopantothenoylcysteine decarboxylase / phosphopantothenate---cysteine ligase
MLRGRRIVLGLTGSIAAYKSAYLLRLLTGAGAEVRVVMTPGAKEFITPLTLGTLSGHPVVSELTEDREAGTWTHHVELGLWGDLILVAPATAHTLSGMAEGRGDSLLLTVLLSAKCPVIVAPAMDRDMWLHPATQANITQLGERGVEIVPPGTGELASGLVGVGRMAEPEDILKHLQDWFAKNAPLAGQRALVTAGPTHEPVDAVRFLGNRSSGRMGLCLAQELARRGCTVDLVCGPLSLGEDEIQHMTGHPLINKIDVETATEMHTAALQALLREPDCDLIIGAAAVADARPAAPIKGKASGSALPDRIDLVSNPDILADLASKRPEGCVAIGFSLASDDGLEAAKKKLATKNCDLIILNSIADQGSGFGHKTNRIRMVWPGNRIDSFELKSKAQVAVDILDAYQNMDR